MTAMLSSGAQWVGHQLATYARLVDRRDSAAIGDMLAGARVTFKDHQSISGADAVAAFYDSAFDGLGPRTVHLPSPPVLELAANGLQYEAPYLRITHRTEQPQLDGTGIYRGLIASRGGVWFFVSFRVDLH